MRFYVWPDLTICDNQELEEYLSFMSDDYMEIEAFTEEEALDIADDILRKL